MQLLYNGQLISEADFHLPFSNRAFQYGDGFFETIILEKGLIRFWAGHLDRIKEAAAVLSFDVEVNGKFLSLLPNLLLQLARLNNCGGLARIKLKVWRSGAGLYKPQTDGVDWLATAQPFQEPSQTPIKIGICQTIRTIPSAFSSFKGINAPVYVLASREKAAKGLDDVLLQDPPGNVAELTSSNIFWVSGKTLYTPALETGCLNGILRRRILSWGTQNGWELKEGLYQLDHLLKANSVFSANVTGIKAIAQIEKENLTMDQELLEKIRREVFYPHDKK